MSPKNNDATVTAINERAVSQLRAAIKGQIITPDDAEYDTARTVFYGGFGRHPEVIVRAADASDVSQIVLFTRDTGVTLAVRGGGHSLAGHSVSDGGIVLDLSAMKRLEIDVEGRTAWAEAGLTAGEYTAATAAHGLATGFGDTGSVGIGGITLSGGIGFLVRKHGLTIDNLLAAEVVTAGGQCLYADSETHPDLFWAMRGGGGNFGVVTRFKFRLHEVDMVVGGMLILPATPEVISGFVAQAESAPEELSTILGVMIAPPLPMIPDEYHGQIIALAQMVYSGDVEAGERVFAPFRSLATPIADMIRPMPYSEMFPPENGEFHPVASLRSMFMDEVTHHMAEVIREHLRASKAQIAVAQIRVLGGAMARVPAEATAFAHRERRIMANLAALYGSPDEKATHEAWLAEFAAALHQGKDGVYVGFLGDEGLARVREAYPYEIWNRLAAIKRRYDPENVFRFNHNIPPALE
jgi:FAD/FMN-containing dehydrogenase